MAAALLLPLAFALHSSAPAPEEPTVLLEPSIRDGRARVELVLVGDPWPEALAKCLRYSGTEARSREVLERFLEEQRALWSVRAREFGLEITVEAPEARLRDVLAAVAPALESPSWTREALELATMELLVARVPGQFDPLERLDRELAGLLDPDLAPPAVLDLDLGALFGGGDDRGGDEGGDGPPPIPGLEPIDPGDLAAAWADLCAGPRAGRLWTDAPGALADDVAGLLEALGRQASTRTELDAAVTPRDWWEHLGPGRTAAYAADAMTPGAMVGLAAALEAGMVDWPEPAASAWIAGLGSSVARTLQRQLQTGTGPQVLVRRSGEGLPSVRIVALVEPTEDAITAALALSSAPGGLRADAEAVGRALDGSEDREDPLQPLLEAALGARTGTVADLASGGPPLSITHRVAVAPEELLERLRATRPEIWRLDRAPLEQSSPAALALRTKALEALGGAEAWSATRSVALSTTVEVAPGRSITTEQWRDLRGSRLLLVQTGAPRVVTAVARGRASQTIDASAPNALPRDTVLALMRSHRGSLLVTLADLAGGRLRVLDVGPAEGLPALPEGAARIFLADRFGDRGVLTIGADGLPLELQAGAQRYAYSGWTSSAGRRVPARVERLGGRPVVYRWSDFSWDVPAPEGL